jgi:hypothetical protein
MIARVSGVASCTESITQAQFESDVLNGFRNGYAAVIAIKSITRTAYEGKYMVTRSLYTHG